jgi:hypothetical protein
MCEDHHILGEAERLVFLEKLVHERTWAGGSNFPLSMSFLRRRLLRSTLEGAKRKKVSEVNCMLWVFYGILCVIFGSAFGPCLHDLQKGFLSFFYKIMEASETIRGFSFRWKSFGRDDPTITHLRFADDNIMFSEASKINLEALQRIILR